MTAGQRVMIVEDQMIIQHHLRLIVQELGYIVSGVAVSAAEAMASAAENTPDLVLMDIRLQGGRDGIEAARELRARYDLAVVFLTAYADEETVGRTRAVRPLGYIVKPFNKPQIRAALSTAFTKHHELRRIQDGKRALASILDGFGEEDAAPARTEPRLFGAGTRMAIYSHDTFGLGHLQRCLKISRALVTRFPGLSILLVTGSPAIHRYVLPQGVDYVKLPAVRKVAAETYEARSLGLSYSGMLRIRTNLVLRSIQIYDPHVFLVDHAPLGMKGEILPALEWLQRNRPCSIKMIGLRDVLDDPESVVELWNRKGIYDVLGKFYDHILIYGSSEVFDPVSAYRFPPDLKSKVFYCNYIGENQTGNELEQPECIASDGKPLVVVTIGGGDGAGEVVIGSYVEMLRRFESEVDFESLILTGPFLASELLSRFREKIRGLPARLLDFVSSTSPYLDRADLVVSTGGYNTVTQILCFGNKALMIPRIMHRKEQLIRARRLAEMGLVTMLHPDDVTPERLYASVRTLLSDPAQPLAEARARSLIRLDGSARFVDFCGRLRMGGDPGKGPANTQD